VNYAPNLTNNDKIWVIGSAFAGVGFAFDLGIATGIAVFGLSIMALGFIRGFICSMDNK